jgi:hypothetical protein
MRRRASFIGVFLGVLALSTLCGCGVSSDRQEVTGEVLLAGQPLQDGVIQFAPLDGQGTGDGAQILAGKYSIPRAKGLSPGKYRVSLYAGDGRSGAGDASPDSPHAGTKPGKERIPPRYNKTSEIVREVTADGSNRFDFDIP